MNYGDHITLSRAKYKKADTKVVTPETHKTIFNNGAIDIARYARLFPTSVNFNIVEDQRDYLLSTVAPKFLLIHESGMWNNEGTQSSPYWDWLWESTVKSLDIERPRWRDESSSTPQYYIIEGNNLKVHPKPSSDLTDGFELWYYSKPETMDSNSDYPFNGSVEIPHMRIFDEPLFLYYRWQASQIVGESRETIAGYKADFFDELSKKISLFNERPDFNRKRRSRVRVGCIARNY